MISACRDYPAGETHIPVKTLQKLTVKIQHGRRILGDVVL
jgi:hypothetical protein